MESDDDRQQIVQWLAGRGHSSEEIEKIMAQLRQYDARIVRESLFDSIESGDFDIDAIIAEALDQTGSE